MKVLLICRETNYSKSYLLAPNIHTFSKDASLLYFHLCKVKHNLTDMEEFLCAELVNKPFLIRFCQTSGIL